MASFTIVGNEMPSGQALVCDHLEVVYGRFKAVDGISFSVETGQVFGLLGPNGAGKTSVVRALTTIIDPSAGSARVSGHPLTDPAGVRSVIGVLPESNGYPESVSGWEYLRYFGRLYGLASADAATRAGSLLGAVGLESVARNPIRTFSRGMRQRLGIARALVNRPSVLFLDEPTLGLDPAGREDVLSLLTSIALSDGTGVVLCSHLLDDVERVCDEIAILDKGRIVSAGTVAEVTARSRVGGVVTITIRRGDEDKAVATLTDTPGVTHVASRQPGGIEAELSGTVEDVNPLLDTLLRAGVSIRAVEPPKIRLSDAFLTLTGEPRHSNDG
jgi:ABC-2 type transport system ATP-binding protein